MVIAPSPPPAAASVPSVAVPSVVSSGASVSALVVSVAASVSAVVVSVAPSVVPGASVRRRLVVVTATGHGDEGQADAEGHEPLGAPHVAHVMVLLMGWMGGS